MSPGSNNTIFVACRALKPIANNNRGNTNEEIIPTVLLPDPRDIHAIRTCVSPDRENHGFLHSISPSKWELIHTTVRSNVCASLFLQLLSKDR